MSPNTLPLPAARSPSPAMLRGWRLRLVHGVWAACAAFILALFLAYLPFNQAAVRDDWLVQNSAVAVSRITYFGAFADYVLALRYVAAAISFGVAALILWRKSDDAVALLVALGLLILPSAFFAGGADNSIYQLYGPPWHTWLPGLRDGLALFALHYLIFLFFIFPNGRFAPQWMKWAAWGGGVILPLLAFGLFQEWVTWEVWSLVFFVWLGLALGSQLYRYLRVSTPAERQQTKWFVVAVALIPFWVLISIFGLPGLPEAEGNLLDLHLQLLLLVSIPLGVGIGVLRRGLWGADPIINRTLVYGLLTLSIILLYVLIVGGLSTLFQSSGSVLLSALVTGAIAFLFQPLRQRLQRLVNRLMYGERDDPATALARLGQRLETAIAPEATLSTIAETVAQTLKVPYAGLQVNGEQSSVISSEWKAAGQVTPTDHRSLMMVPLIYQSETLGHLLVAPRTPGEAFSAADRRLLEQIVQQAAPAVHAYRLTADLQRSRERLVTTREEERRRLHRDLHDGLGPALASQSLKLDAALDLMDHDPATARALLTEVKAQAQATVTDIRRVVYELRPPALEARGLVAALREVAARYNTSGLSVTFDATPESEWPPLPAAVEVAVYRIVLEALTNVARHARATRCAINLELKAQTLHVEVGDNGMGLPAEPREGVGLASMRERAAELGGNCLIQPKAMGGTQVSATLPIVYEG
ncbi:MAG: histidine kinase [Anaerolineales bacterium]